MSRTLSLISSVTAVSLAAAAALLSAPSQAGSSYPDIQAFIANRLVPSMNAICSGIAEQAIQTQAP